LIYLKLVLVALIWGGSFIATRVIAQSFEPFIASCIRYLISIVFLLPLAFKGNRKFLSVTKSQFWLLILMGFSGIFIYNFFFFKGLQLVPASHGALLVALNPSMVIILSAIWYREKINGLQAIGVMLSLLGVMLVISRGQLSTLLSDFQLGDAYMLACPFAWAIYTLAGREALKKVSPIDATTWAALSGLVMLLLFAFTEQIPSSITPKIWAGFAYLGILSTVIAFIWYNDGIKEIGATKTSIFNNLVPVFALLLSVLILHEQVSSYTWIGGFLVIGGVLLTNRF
jgi:drug/metabolite transporter (DMT)-like permease